MFVMSHACIPNVVHIFNDQLANPRAFYFRTPTGPMQSMLHKSYDTCNESCRKNFSLSTQILGQIEFSQ